MIPTVWQQGVAAALREHGFEVHVGAFRDLLVHHGAGPTWRLWLHDPASGSYTTYADVAVVVAARYHDANTGTAT